MLSAQINPHGFIHEVLTLREALNVVLAGPPVPADSWFPGFEWRYCLCASCQSHLGWSYHRPEAASATFFGLRRGGLVED
jgi:cereblon